MIQSDTQILYAWGKYDNATRKNRYLRVTLKLSLENIFVVEEVEAVDHREEHPGLMVFEVDFPISVKEYHDILAERADNDFTLARAKFNRPNITVPVAS